MDCRGRCTRATGSPPAVITVLKRCGPNPAGFGCVAGDLSEACATRRHARTLLNLEEA